MGKNILWALLGAFVLLVIMGALLASKMTRSGEFFERMEPPTVLEMPAENPFRDIRVVKVPGSDTIRLGAETGLAFINFWATWCGPCISELPAIEKLYQAQKDKLAFYVVSTNDPEGRIMGFMKRRGYTFPVYRLVRTPETDSLLAQIPVSLLARDSSLIIRENSAANWNDLSVHQLVEQMAAEPEQFGMTNR